MKYFDESFIKECCRGKELARKQLFDDLYTSMFRVCLRYINNTPDAEDTVMCGFVKVFKNIKGFKFEGEHSLFMWIRRIMINESLMLLRKKRTNFMLSLDETFHDIPIDNEIMSNMNAEELNAIIMELPPGYRTVFNLYVVEGYEHKEIAALLRIRENTSRTQLVKARNKLQLLIKQREGRYGKYGR